LGSLQKWRFHPLIHTIALKELAQNVVVNPNEAECRLKYVIHSSGDQRRLQIMSSTVTALHTQ